MVTTDCVYGNICRPGPPDPRWFGSTAPDLSCFRSVVTTEAEVTCPPGASVWKIVW